MKKKVPALFLICLITISVAGCNDNDAAQPENSGSNGLNNPAAGAKNVDVDLTVLSTTMAYAEINNILTNPDGYMGKTVKMKGRYYSSFYDVTGMTYHFVVIEDATSCCAQGVLHRYDQLTQPSLQNPG